MLQLLTTVTVSVSLLLFSGHEKLELLSGKSPVSGSTASFRTIPSGGISRQSLFDNVHKIHLDDDGQAIHTATLSGVVVGKDNNIKTFYLSVSDDLSIQLTTNSSLASIFTFKPVSAGFEGYTVGTSHFIHYSFGNATYVLLVCRTEQTQVEICLNRYRTKPPRAAVPLVTRPYKTHCPMPRPFKK